MIDCIMQLPQRMGTNTFLSCAHRLSPWRSPTEENVYISGRSIRVVPLTFYKVFSRWGTNRYEHTFVTDEPFDSIYLTSYRSGVTKQIEHSNMSSVLYPISVKKITPYHVSTHLFTKSCDVLLQYYRQGIPLSTIQPLIQPPMENKGCLSPDCIEGVCSFAEYQKFIFHDVFIAARGQYELTPQQQTVISALTPEKPEYINSCVDEIIYNGLNGDALFQYIDDCYVYSSGEHINPVEWLGEHIYDEWPLDPITLVCVLSPPHIILSNLIPYLGDLLTRISYNRVGFSYQNDPLFDGAQPIRFNNLDGLKLYELVESLLSIPDTDFQIEMTWDNYVPHFTSMFGYATQLANENIHNVCRILFLDRWHNGGVGAIKAVLSKNWLDEVVVWCEHEDGRQQVFYLSLAWFHLTSPSLINRSLFFKRY